MSDSLAARVSEIIAAHAQRPLAELGPDVRLDALGLDSLKMVETVFAIEEAFDVTIPFSTGPEEGSGDMTTVGEVIAVVRDLFAARKP